MKRALFIVIPLLVIFFVVGFVVFLEGGGGVVVDSVRDNIFPEENPGAPLFSPDNSEFLEPGDESPRIFLEGRLHRLAENVAGPAFVKSLGVGTSTVRYVERDTGHVFEIDLVSGASVRITNTTVPRVLAVLWGNGGTHLIAQRLDARATEVETFVATIDEDGGALRSTLLPPQTDSVAISTARTRIAFMRGNFEGATLYTTDFSARGFEPVFESPIPHWQIAGFSGDLIALYPSPSANATGMLYIVRANTGALSRVGKGHPGLTAAPDPAFAYALIGEAAGGAYHTFVWDIENGGELNDLRITTLPEKCVWAALEEMVVYCAIPQTMPPGDYPDGWYRGDTSFSDTLWRINIDTGTRELVRDFVAEDDHTFDAVNLVLSPNEKFLLFQNKSDGSLWSLKLEEGTVSTSE